MGLAILIQRRLNGQRSAPGARAATREIELADYEAMFASRMIFTGIREENSGDASRSLFERLLGEAYDNLPVALRILHGGAKNRSFHGFAQIERGAHPFARLVAGLLRFPRAGEYVPVKVTIEAASEREIWRRDFGGRTFRSELRLGRGRNDRLIVERFGMIEVGLALVVEDNRLHLIPRRISIFGVPLPRAMLPRGETYESETDGQFCFHVEIALPAIGLVVRYQGSLARL